MNNQDRSADPPDSGSRTLDPSDWPGFRTPGAPDAGRHSRLRRKHPRAPRLAADPGRGAVPVPRRSSRGAFRSCRRSSGIHAAISCPSPPATYIPVSWAGFMAGAHPWAYWRRCWRPGLNANLGGRDHIPIEVERQIVRWMQRIFGFPESATGLFVTGTSMANLIGVLIARDTELGFEVALRGCRRELRKGSRPTLRWRPIAASGKPWTFPASAAMRCA